MGMAVVFPWKNTVFLGVVCTAAVAGGKAAGGFLSDRDWNIQGSDGFSCFCSFDVWIGKFLGSRYTGAFIF